MAWWNDVISGATELGKGAGSVYQAFNGSSSKEDEAYLRGQNEALSNQLKASQDADIIKIGSLEISTSSVLWIIGGTLGLLAVGIGIKKLL